MVKPGNVIIHILIKWDEREDKIEHETIAHVMLCDKKYKQGLHHISTCLQMQLSFYIVPLEEFNLSVIILASLLVSPMLGCPHFFAALKYFTFFSSRKHIF